MTEREKAKYLREQGWKLRLFLPGTTMRYWHDPLNPQRCAAIETAYRIAQQRQARRERRRLHESGCAYGEAEAPRCGIGWWRVKDMYWMGETRAEAIRLLDKGQSKC